jgi:hypothetical protein
MHENRDGKITDKLNLSKAPSIKKPLKISGFFIKNFGGDGGS